MAQDFRCSERSCWWGLCIYALVQVVDSDERMEGLDSEWIPAFVRAWVGVRED